MRFLTNFFKSNSTSLTPDLQIFQDQLNTSLEKYSADLIVQLQNISRNKFNPRIHHFSFEIHQRENAFNLMLYSMDEENNEVFNLNNEQNLFAGSKVILKDIIYFTDLTSLTLYHLYERYDKQVDNIFIKSVIDWFERCWSNTDLSRLPYPSYISRHDSTLSYDLKNREWSSAF